MDREYKKVMSVSPLKHRVDLDVEVSPIRIIGDTQRSTQTPHRSKSRTRQ